MFYSFQHPFLWSVIFGIIVCIWIWVGYRLYVGLTSRNWIMVSGKIIKAKTKKRKGKEFVFEYLVNGKWYRSKNISFALFRSAETTKINQYKKNALVRVFYHPLVPVISVLKPGLSNVDILFLSACFFCTSLLVGGGVWWIIANWI